MVKQRGGVMIGYGYWYVHTHTIHKKGQFLGVGTPLGP